MNMTDYDTILTSALTSQTLKVKICTGIFLQLRGNPTPAAGDGLWCTGVFYSYLAALPQLLVMVYDILVFFTVTWQPYPSCWWWSMIYWCFLQLRGNPTPAAGDGLWYTGIFLQLPGDPTPAAGDGLWWTQVFYSYMATLPQLLVTVYDILMFFFCYLATLSQLLVMVYDVLMGFFFFLQLPGDPTPAVGEGLWCTDVFLFFFAVTWRSYPSCWWRSMMYWWFFFFYSYLATLPQLLVTAYDVLMFLFCSYLAKLPQLLVTVYDVLMGCFFLQLPGDPTPAVGEGLWCTGVFFTVTWRPYPSCWWRSMMYWCFFLQLPGDLTPAAGDGLWCTDGLFFFTVTWRPYPSCWWRSMMYWCFFYSYLATLPQLLVKVYDVLVFFLQLPGDLTPAAGDGLWCTDGLFFFTVTWRLYPSCWWRSMMYWCFFYSYLATLPQLLVTVYDELMQPLPPALAGFTSPSTASSAGPGTLSVSSQPMAGPASSVSLPPGSNQSSSSPQKRWEWRETGWSVCAQSLVRSENEEKRVGLSMVKVFFEARIKRNGLVCLLRKSC